MGLFNIDPSGRVLMNPDSIAIPTFRALWDRDKSKTKERATMEISYVVFLCDYKSPYRSYSESDRSKIVKEDFIRNSEWEPDELIQEAIKKYNEFQETTFSRLVNKSLKLADKLSDYMDTIEFSGKDERQARETVDTIVKTLEKVGNIVKSLTTLKKQVETDSTEQTNVRGKAEIGDYELPEQ